MKRVTEFAVSNALKKLRQREQDGLDTPLRTRPDGIKIRIQGQKAPAAVRHPARIRHERSDRSQFLRAVPGLLIKLPFRGPLSRLTRIHVTAGQFQRLTLNSGTELTDQHDTLIRRQGHD